MQTGNLAKILLSAFLTASATVLCFRWIQIDTKSRLGEILKMLLHYVCLCIIMVVCGKWFGWIGGSSFGALGMILSVAVVYALTAGIYILIDLRQADSINQKLKERFEEDEQE